MIATEENLAKVKRGQHFRHRSSKAVRRRNGVEETTDLCVITAKRRGGVYWQHLFPDGETGMRMRTALEPNPRHPKLFPGFLAEVVAWVDPEVEGS